MVKRRQIATRTKDGMIYEGAPQEIINDIGEQITQALNNSGIHASGIHAIALLHVAASLIKEINAGEAPGKAPSFATVLKVITHSMNHTQWTGEELQEFNKDFCEIVESLGGRNMGPRPERNDITWLVSPSLGVH